VAWREDGEVRWFKGPQSLESRALRLAISDAQRARLMLPSGVLAGVAFEVTSMYCASDASVLNVEPRTSVSRATIWNGALDSFHGTLAFSIQ